MIPKNGQVVLTAWVLHFSNFGSYFKETTSNLISGMREWRLFLKVSLPKRNRKWAMRWKCSIIGVRTECLDGGMRKFLRVKYMDHVYYISPEITIISRPKESIHMGSRVNLTLTWSILSLVIHVILISHRKVVQEHMC